MNVPSPVGTQRPGGRSARTRAAVLAATIEVLGEAGFEALTFDEVARRAGVHKTTVYRRWPTKAELIADATRERSLGHVPVPDTGALAGDLQALARSVAANIGSPTGSVMACNLVAATITSSELGAGGRAFWSERLALTGVIVERAVARGELPDDTDPDLVIETLIGSLYVRLLLTGGAVDRRTADLTASIVAAGVVQHPPRRNRPPAGRDLGRQLGRGDVTLDPAQS